MKKINPLLILLFMGFIFLMRHSPLTAAQGELSFPSLSGHYDKIRVLRVISSDTIELTNNEKVRLIGLKALPPPKNRKVERDDYGFVVKDNDTPFATIEEASFNFARALLEGKDVRLVLDKQKKDENFLTLAYVFLFEEGLFANEEILKNGFAELQIRPPNMKYAEKLRAAYIEARTEKRGLHNSY